ncbi:MAG: radical SAM protein, partial [Erysipelotrichaceae bacterium]|nr:radical SAM protein [Erysipelotrichaceae bacterium]
MKDLYGRTIDYMRISITDRCNLRCRYCMPNGIDLLPMEDLLTYEEILEVCRQAVKLGISKFKITGGEPLVRKGCTELIEAIKFVEGVQQVTLTTNGLLLEENIQRLKEAGVDGINVSLDTTDPDRFEQITGFDRMHKVLAGMESVLQTGIPLKINCLLQKG